MHELGRGELSPKGAMIDDDDEVEEEEEEEVGVSSSPMMVMPPFSAFFFPSPQKKLHTRELRCRSREMGRDRTR